MASKVLNARQALWAEILAENDFIFKYCPGKTNTAADTFTRREQDLEPQNKTKAMMSDNVLLKSHQLEKPSKDIAVNFMETFAIADKLPTFNRNQIYLEDQRSFARNGSNSKFKLENGILTYDEDRLVVPDVDNIRTFLVQDAHNQPSTAYPGSIKTFKLLASRYYGRGMEKFIQ